jgi:hypothetical protein
MFTKNTVVEAAETVGEAAPVDPAELVPLAELAAEGFGWGSQYVTTPRDAIEGLARQLEAEVVLDDIGRRCVSRDTARRLFAERATAEERQREARQRREAELAERAPRRPAGRPAIDGLSAFEVMIADEDAEQKEFAGRRMEDYMRGVDSGYSFVIRPDDVS